MHTFWKKLQFYKITEKKDARLWEYFREHFDGWPSTLFHIASPEVRGELRDHLRSRGVFVNNRKRIDYALHDTLCETEQHEWTFEELAKARKDGDFVSAVYHATQIQNPSQQKHGDKSISILPQNIDSSKEKSSAIGSYDNVIDKIFKANSRFNLETDQSNNRALRYGSSKNSMTAKTDC